MRAFFLQAGTNLLIGALNPIEWALSGVVCRAALVASGHAVIYKREPRSAASGIVGLFVESGFSPLTRANAKGRLYKVTNRTFTTIATRPTDFG
jgi:hypothetical protein